MSVRRFQLVFEDDGSVFHCAAFESEAALDALLAGAQPAASVALPPPASLAATRPRGRPSHAPAIDAAVRSLGRRLDRRKSVAEQARRVLHHIARSCDNPDLIPKRRTVEIALRRKTRGK